MFSAASRKSLDNPGFRITKNGSCLNHLFIYYRNHFHAFQKLILFHCSQIHLKNRSKEKFRI